MAQKMLNLHKSKYTHTSKMIRAGKNLRLDSKSVQKLNQK